MALDERLPQIGGCGVVRPGPSAPRVREGDGRRIEQDDGRPRAPAQVVCMAHPYPADGRQRLVRRDRFPSRIRGTVGAVFNASAGPFDGDGFYAARSSKWKLTPRASSSGMTKVGGSSSGAKTPARGTCFRWISITAAAAAAAGRNRSAVVPRGRFASRCSIGGEARTPGFSPPTFVTRTSTQIPRAPGYGSIIVDGLG